MTEPDEQPSTAAAPESAPDRDPERLEEMAEELPVDPSPQQVDAYRAALGDGDVPDHS